MTAAQALPTPATSIVVPEPRPESISRERLVATLQGAARCRLTVVCAPAGFGKTTALAQWLERRGVTRAWLSLDEHDNDPRVLVAHLLAALDHALPGDVAAAERALHGGSDIHATVIPLAVNALAEREARLAMVLDDYHLISSPACHRVTMGLIDALPSGVAVVVASRTPPPLRLARRRAAGTLAEIGPAQLRFAIDEADRLLNASLGLGLEPRQLELIEERVEGWAAGLALIASALPGHRDRAGFLDALAASRASLEAYLVEEVLEAARPELRDFLCRTSILSRLTAPLCEAVLADARAGELLEEVRAMNLFVTTLDPEDTWVRYHDMFADALRAELERRDADLVDELHRRASRWLEEAGMHEEAIEHALASDDGPRAAALLAASWFGLINDRRYVTLRRLLDRLPEDRGEFDSICEALDIVCQLYEGVDQRLTYERTEALVERHGDDPAVRIIADVVRISPFYGDVGRAVEFGREAWERYAQHPAARMQVAAMYGFVLWFAGEYEQAREILEPRVLLDQPAFPRVWTLGTLSATAADEGDAELAERYAREATKVVEEVGAQTATEFTGLPIVLGEALRLNGKLEEARANLTPALMAEAKRPGSVGHTMALVYDAQLALSEGDLGRARRSARRARRFMDLYRDLGQLERRLAAIEGQLATPRDKDLLGTRPTPAELRVLPLLDSDRSLSEIAAELYLSPHTVKSHVRRLYRRLGAGSRAEAVAAARERGLLER